MSHTLWNAQDEQPPGDSRDGHPTDFQLAVVGFPLAGSPERVEPVVFPELAGSGSPPRTPLDARERAHQIVREAEREAQALREVARQKGASMAEEGYREGRLQGRAEALAERRGRLRQLAAALEAAVARLRTLEEEFRARGSDTIVSLALAVAERICRAEIAQDPGGILGAVRAALALLPEPSDVVVRVHPEQFAMVQEHQDEVLAPFNEGSRLRLLPDPAVEAGGCLVETPGCLVDATLAGQLEEAHRRLRGDPL